MEQLYSDIVTTRFSLDEDGGLLAIPTGPCLGIELDWDAVRYYSGEK